MPTTSQMRALEADAIESGAVTGLELMERAGRGVVAAMETEWPDLVGAAARAVVLCGPGNNGGDGFVVARLLAGKGWKVDVYFLGSAASLPRDARENYDRWQKIGQTRPWEDCAPDQFLPDHDGLPLVIDAVFGIGLSRPAPAEVTDILAAAKDCRRVAVDVPSILSADAGACLCEAQCSQPASDLTVTFHAPKPGHLLGQGPFHCGQLRVVDIGLSAVSAPGGLVLSGPPFPGLSKRAGHKFSHGHALIVSGGFGRSGAARLAARAALRVGAGLVTVGAPDNAMMECATQLTAIMLRRCDAADGLSEIMSDKRINALCLGPGLGLDARGAALVDAALSSGRQVVLDADALTLLSEDPELMGRLHSGCVLTPHGGEFARLFPDIAARLDGAVISGPGYSKVDATRDAAAQAGCVVLYKGADTVIADPSGAAVLNAAVYERAAPWLATAGSGDVLAGLVVGLLARGMAPMQAAGLAAWLHVETARGFGPGLIAEDLPERLPKVLSGLEPAK